MAYKLGTILLTLFLLGLVGCAKDTVSKKDQETVKLQKR
jgi:hypothetical protein